MKALLCTIISTAALSSILFVGAPMQAQTTRAWVVQADALTGESITGSRAFGVTFGREWQRPTFHVSATLGLLRPAYSTDDLRQRNGPANALLLFPRVGAGIRVFESSHFRVSATSSIGPWLNLLTEDRADGSYLRTRSEVEYRATAGTLGGESCWRRTARGMRICGLGTAVRLLPGFGLSRGQSVGPLWSIAFRR